MIAMLSHLLIMLLVLGVVFWIAQTIFAQLPMVVVTGVVINIVLLLITLLVFLSLIWPLVDGPLRPGRM